MGYEVTRSLPITTKRIETPLTALPAPVIAGKKVAIVPILRAGLGMADGLLELIPSARMGHIGAVPRRETKRPVEYFVKLPEPEGRIFILCDPMLAPAIPPPPPSMCSTSAACPTTRSGSWRWWRRRKASRS